MQYWYTAQLRNYRLQFIRAFSNFHVNNGKDANGVDQIVQVPCRYGDPSRIASTIISGNSENKLLSVPFITCIVNNISMAPTRRQDPSFVSKVQVNEREYDDETGHYLQNVGNRYTIERYMPIPYELTMQVDVWTNNTSIKEQLLEQILTLYNPSIEIQTSNNPLDWTVLSLIELQDQISWTSRTIPVGTDNPIDVMTLSFKMPIWINPPAKVQKQKIIEEIVTNIIQGEKESSEQWDWTEYEFFNRIINTPGDYSIALEWIGNNSYKISLRSEGGDPKDPASLPTITSTMEHPVLTPGSSFIYNGIAINITSSDINAVVTAGHAALAGTNYNILLYNKKQIRFVNNSGGDNSFGNMVGQPIQDMGLIPTSYPGGNLSWDRLFEAYGTLKQYSQFGTNASQLRIRLDIDDANKDIIGWISSDPVNQNEIIWTLDSASLPTTTMPPVNAVINPNKVSPGNGLPLPSAGQRYLLLEKPAANSAGWGNMIDATVNDVVQFNGTDWEVSFSSERYQFTVQYLVNLYNGKLLEWQNGAWAEYIQQAYAPGEWRLAM